MLFKPLPTSDHHLNRVQLLIQSAFVALENVLRGIVTGETWIAGTAFNDTITPLVAGVGFFTPDANATNHFALTFNAGNTTVSARAELWDVTGNATMIMRETITGDTVPQERTLKLAVGNAPALGQVSSRRARYEVRVYVVAAGVPTDFVQLWKANFYTTAAP